MSRERPQQIQTRSPRGYYLSPAGPTPKRALVFRAKLRRISSAQVSDPLIPAVVERSGVSPVELTLYLGRSAAQETIRLIQLTASVLAATGLGLRGAGRHLKAGVLVHRVSHTLDVFATEAANARWESDGSNQPGGLPSAHRIFVHAEEASCFPHLHQFLGHGDPLFSDNWPTLSAGLDDIHQFNKLDIVPTVD